MLLFIDSLTKPPTHSVVVDFPIAPAIILTATASNIFLWNHFLIGFIPETLFL
jgi:hypothetical protein